MTGLDRDNTEDVGEVIEKVWFGWFTLGTVVCEVVGSGVDTLLVLLRTICIEEILGDILGLDRIGVVLVLVCGTVSELLLGTCEHLVLGIIGCNGPSINCLKRLSGSLTVLELFFGVSTTVL